MILPFGRTPTEPAAGLHCTSPSVSVTQRSPASSNGAEMRPVSAGSPASTAAAGADRNAAGAPVASRVSASRLAGVRRTGYLQGVRPVTGVTPYYDADGPSSRLRTAPVGFVCGGTA